MYSLWILLVLRQQGITALGRPRSRIRNALLMIFVHVAAGVDLTALQVQTELTRIVVIVNRGVAVALAVDRTREAVTGRGDQQHRTTDVSNVVEVNVTIVSLRKIKALILLAPKNASSPMLVTFGKSAVVNC